MNEISLPALDGRSPLGILAALGLLRLLEVHTDDTPLLAWSPDGLTAVLHTTRPDVDAVVLDLESIVAGIEPGAVLPGVPAGFPPPRDSPARLKFAREEFEPWATSVLEASPAEQLAEVGAWLGSLASDVARTREGNVAASLFVAISGQQTVTTMLSKPLELVRDTPDYLRQALVGWRRVPGVTGEYLDHRAMWDATESVDGATGMMRGVPGATWLALMSFPLFRTTAGPGPRQISTGWHTVQPKGGRQYLELRLPVWTQPVSTAGAVSLLEHPAMAPRRPDIQPGSRRRDDGVGVSAQMRALGIVSVCRARRRQPPGSKSAGVLTTIR